MPRLRASVPWAIMRRPGTWMGWRVQPRVNSVSLMDSTRVWRPGEREEPAEVT